MKRKKYFIFILLLIFLLGVNGFHIPSGYMSTERTSAPFRSGNSRSTKSSISGISQDWTWSGTLDYNSYLAKQIPTEIDDDYQVDWSFTGSNNFVGITLRAMTSVNFQKFKDGVAYSYFILSEGNYCITSGSWTPPSKAYWYLVFINWDPDQQTTDVTLEYDLTELGDILALTPSSPLYLGRSYDLTWISSYDGLTEPNPNVIIDLYRGASFLSTIASSTSNDETYNWNIPLTLTPGTDYRIKISSTIRPSLVFDYSSYFEVAVFSEISQLSMSSSSLVMSQQVTIEWDYTYEGSTDPNPSVKIELYKGLSYVETITSSTSNDGLYEWTVPDDVEPEATYRIKVSSVADPDNVYTWSDSFEIEEVPSLPDLLPLLVLLGIGVGGLLSILFLVRRRRKKVVPMEPPTPTVPSTTSVIQKTPSSLPNLKGCFHTERPKMKQCTHCGELLCYDCIIEEVIGERVIAHTSVDREVRKDFGFFCPSCYLQFTDSDKFKKPKKVKIYNPFSLGIFEGGFFTFMFVLCIISFPILVGFVVLPLIGFFYLVFVYEGKEIYEKFIEKRQKAQRQLEGFLKENPQGPSKRQMKSC